MIQDASRMEWPPVEYDIVLVERIFELVGEEGMYRLCGSISETTATHLLKADISRGSCGLWH
ncbi:MAG: hypothetical protein GY822_15380 [Deltaproteobacteria bacterium]|nr:hypothetical protein [Deltaproteobacteria bacterium]